MTDNVLHKQIDSTEKNLNGTNSMSAVQSKIIGIEIQGILFYKYKRGNRPWFECCLTYLAFAYLSIHSIMWRMDSVLGRKCWKINSKEHQEGGWER